MVNQGDLPAFPVPDVSVGEVSGNWLGHYRQTSDGVSTRLYLAAKAMEGLLAGGARTSGIAPVAFSIADEMLAVLYAPGRLEKVSDDLQDLKAAVNAIQPFLGDATEAFSCMTRDQAKADAFVAASRKVCELLTKLK